MQPNLQSNPLLFSSNKPSPVSVVCVCLASLFARVSTILFTCYMSVVFWLFANLMLKIKLNAAKQERQDISSNANKFFSWKEVKTSPGKVKKREERSTTQTGQAAYHSQPLSFSFLSSSSAGQTHIGIYETSHFSPPRFISSFPRRLLSSKGTLCLFSQFLSRYPNTKKQISSRQMSLHKKTTVLKCFG